jgi:hypothetical protein
MPKEKLTREQTIEKLVAILNDPENLKESREMIQTQKEFLKYANDWYEAEQERLYQKNKDIRIC